MVEKSNIAGKSPNQMEALMGKSYKIVRLNGGFSSKLDASTMEIEGFGQQHREKHKFLDDPGEKHGFSTSNS
jgi:hypothetical protein